jgi:uncharacterized protein DUF1801
VEERAMAELKTKQTDASVEKFIQSVADEERQRDCRTLMGIMQAAAKAPPKMWGGAIVGFGNVHLRYESGRELDWFPIGFSPRKQNLALYLSGGLEPLAVLLRKLGKHKTSKGCLYINKLDEIDLPTLKRIIQQSVRAARASASG